MFCLLNIAGLLNLIHRYLILLTAAIVIRPVLVEVRDLDLVLYTAPDFRVKVKHINLVSLWILLTLVQSASIQAMYRMQSRYNGYYWRLLYTLVPLTSQSWLIWYVYKRWVQFLIIEAQILYCFPALSLLCHTIYQVYFLLMADSLCQLTRHLKYFNAAFNVVMVIHAISIVTVVWQDGLQQWLDIMILVCIFEMIYRLYAFIMFLKLKVTASASAPQIEESIPHHSSDLVVTGGSMDTRLYGLETPIQWRDDGSSSDVFISSARSTVDNRYTRAIIVVH